MSTKIYNGYRLPKMGIDELMRRLHAFGARLDRIQRRAFNSKAAAIAVGAIDALAVGRDHELLEAGKTRAFDAVDYVAEKHREVYSTMRRNPDFDFGCSVSLIFRPNAIYALLYTDRDDMRRTWEHVPGVSDYHYQNSTDGPKTISESAWRRRAKEWDLAMPNGVPAQVSLNFDPLSKSLYCFAKELMPSVSAIRFEDRLARLAKEIVFHRRFSPRFKRLIDKSNVGRVFVGCERWMKTDAGLAAIGQESARIAKRLKPKITKDDLFVRFPKKAEK